MLRKTAREIETRSAHGTLLHVYDFVIFARFLLSVLWPAAVSKQAPFGQIFLEPNVQEEIRLSLLEPDASVTKYVHCQILKIRDALGRISATRWEGVAASPFMVIRCQTAIYTFIFAGYLVRYFVPYVPTKKRAKLGFVRSTRQLFVPSIEMRQVPELMHLLAVGYGKAHTGKVAF